MPIIQPFTDEQFRAANAEWGANCGPGALAFALQTSLDHALFLLPTFKGYVNPTMMKAALKDAGRRFSDIRPPPAKPGYCQDIEKMFNERLAVCRIQWEGPWTQPGANPRWAYRHTHWVATWIERGVELVFDVNGGIVGLEKWDTTIAPQIMDEIENSSGHWSVTHVLRLHDA